MDWLLKLAAVWFCADVVVIATGWYLVKVIKPYFPGWWKQTVVDDGPEVEPDLEPVAPPTPAKPSYHHH